MPLHKWKRRDYDKRKVDNFALDSGYHNGPKCVNCGESFCVHCHPERLKEKCQGKSNGKSKRPAYSDKNLAVWAL